MNRLPPAPGEDDAEVWVPPSGDCMDYAHAPCEFCGSQIHHTRTERCGKCGRRSYAARQFFRVREERNQLRLKVAEQANELDRLREIKKAAIGYMLACLCNGGVPELRHTLNHAWDQLLTAVRTHGGFDG